MARVKEAELNYLRSRQKAARGAEFGGAITTPFGAVTVPAELGDMIMEKIDAVEQTFLQDTMPADSLRSDPGVQPLFADAHYLRRERRERAAFAEAVGSHAAVAALGVGDVDLAIQILDRSLRAAAHSVEAGPDEALLWECLLGLHKSMGNELELSLVALRYAIRFGRSCPVQYEAVDEKAASARAAAPPADQWMCPPKFDAIAGRDLLGHCLQNNIVIYKWRDLREIESDTCQMLATCLHLLADASIEVASADAQVLGLLLTEAVGRHPDRHGWWLALLAFHRHCGASFAYEELAANYADQFGGSAPSWQPPPMVRKSFGERGQAQRIRLAGVISSLTPETLGRWLRTTAPLGAVVFDCTHLVALDFYSGATLVNWCADAVHQGSRPVFSHVHPLLKMCLANWGLEEYAELS